MNRSGCKSAEGRSTCLDDYPQVQLVPVNHGNVSLFKLRSLSLLMFIEKLHCIIRFPLFPLAFIRYFVPIFMSIYLFILELLNFLNPNYEKD